MANMTLSIPDELHKKMKRLEYVRWSEVARKSFEEKVKLLEKVDKLVRNSNLSKKDAESISKKINRAVYNKLSNEFDSRHKRDYIGVNKR